MAFSECIGSAGEWFDIAGYVVNVVVSLLTAYDLKTFFVESFWVRHPLRRNREVKLMEPNNSLMNQLALDFNRGINSFSIRATLFLLGMWLFPSLPMRFARRIS
jgi:hypothetical protein